MRTMLAILTPFLPRPLIVPISTGVNFILALPEKPNERRLRSVMLLTNSNTKPFVSINKVMASADIRYEFY